MDPRMCLVDVMFRRNSGAVLRKWLEIVRSGIILIELFQYGIAYPMRW